MSRPSRIWVPVFVRKPSLTIMETFETFSVAGVKEKRSTHFEVDPYGMLMPVARAKKGDCASGGIEPCGEHVALEKSDVSLSS
jgi:hypothetical protein